VIKLNVILVENLNFFLQLLHRASVLVRGLKKFGQWCWKGFSSVFKLFVLFIRFLNITISAIYCNLLI